jgi:hypothetical protein
MSALDIQPHSRHGSTLAVAMLSLLAVGAFVAGLNNQLIGPRGLPPFPTATAPRAADAIPEATPTPDMQIAAAAVAPRPAKPAPVLEEAATANVAPPVAAAAAPPAVNATETAPEPAPAPPPAPVPDNAEPPT